MTSTNAKGAFFQTSDDLMNWSEPLMIRGSDAPNFRFLQLTKSPDRPSAFMAYPSLLDPTDTTLNFERTGRRPYVYYTVNHGGTDRDLYRVQIEFTR
jgi:hypothetical protein